MGTDRWTDAFLDGMRFEGDPEADRVVRRLFEEGQVVDANALMRTLVYHDQSDLSGLPPILAEYLDQSGTLPDWADPALIRRGEDFFALRGLLVGMALHCASLPWTYASHPGVEVLRLTARLATDTRRRVIETGVMVFSVMERGGLQPGGKGVRAAQKVRLMHAAVRHLITEAAAADPSVWRPEWGVPINQEDLASTLASFTHVVLRSLERVGVKVVREDAEAYLHAWRVVGHIMGLGAEMMPETLDEAEFLAESNERRHFAASPAGQQMAAALLNYLEYATPGTLFDGVPARMMRRLLGDETADLLAIPPERTDRLAGRILRVLLSVKSTIEADDPEVADVTRLFSKALVTSWFLVERGGERPAFSMPTELAQQWDAHDPLEGTQPPAPKPSEDGGRLDLPLFVISSAASLGRRIFDRLDDPLDDAGRALMAAHEAVVNRIEDIADVGKPDHPPGRPWIMAQTWEHLLFAHWRIDERILRPLVPAGLEIEQFDGSAWISVVPMRMANLRLRGLPGAPGLDDFPEMNFRTYVVRDGRPGVFFFSLDAGESVNVWVARNLFHLPYYQAELTMRSDGTAFEFSSHRRMPGGQSADFAARYAPKGDPGVPEEGSLDHFLNERYSMYSVDGDGDLYRGDIQHPLWEIQDAEAEITVNTLGAAMGIPLPPEPPLLRYAARTDVRCWPMVHLG